MSDTPSQRFRNALREEQPLQIAGAINAYSAMLAEAAGFHAIYLSGSGVAAASFGLPDLGLTTANDVVEDVRRITAATRTPLLVDIDTGWGNELNIARTVKSMVSAGAAAVHLEDQVSQKRCGHRPNKMLVSQQEMCARIESASEAGDDLYLIARTDALAVEGINATIDRSNTYIESGADAIFLEAATDLEVFQQVTDACKAPVLANMTEFGQTPLFTLEELRSVGVAMALYPLSAFRAMSRAAQQVYSRIRSEGTQASVLEFMQTRSELYDVLGYEEFERRADELLSRRHREYDGDDLNG